MEQYYYEFIVEKLMEAPPLYMLTVIVVFI